MGNSLVTSTNTNGNYKIGRGILAVIVGALVDMGGTNIFAAIYTVLVFLPKAISLASKGMSQIEIQSQLLENTEAITLSPFMIIVGSMFSLIGGFIAGKISKHNEILHGFLVGILILLLSTVCGTGLREPGLFTSFFKIFLLLVSFGVNATGGYLAYLQRKKQGEGRTIPN